MSSVLVYSTKLLKCIQKHRDEILQVLVLPEVLAKLFWELSDVQQAEFFEALHDITFLESSYGLGELQWCYMGKEIDKRPRAKAQACSMMAWIYGNTTEWLQKRL